ncbi:MAG: type II toxin-antitoxin system VapC family toxin [Candidatus Poribacteria bacterium]|nr:type II toxin-antitoxin system VapC family toxin [Candidatus Poribacteria bacterium]
METDWAVDYLRGDPVCVERLHELSSEGLGMSVVTLAELYVGISFSSDPTQAERELQGFLERVSVLPLDEETCRWFGRERARLKRAGQQIERLDLLIGATCLRHGLTLLTNNVRHFGRLDGLHIISLR